MRKNTSSLPEDEQRPQASHIQWEEIFSAIPHPSMILDQDHRIITANRALLDILCVGEPDITGKRWYEVFHDNQVLVPGCQSDAGIPDCSAKPVEIEMKGRTYSVTCTPFHEYTGSATRFIHISTDISRQKMEEKSAQDLNQRYRLLSEQLPCSIWTTDRDLRYTSSVGGGLRRVGLEPNQLVGKTIADFYEGQPERELALEAYRRVLLGEKQTYETQYRGQKFIADIEPLHNEKNEIIGTLGVAHDITEQKQTQFVIEQINRKYTLLNSIIQHDTRNKITSVMAYLSLLKEKVPDPVLRKEIDKIDPIVDELAELNEFTRTYQNLGLKSPQWEDIESLIRKLPAGPIRITNDLQGLKILADPMLENVFFNLLDNAIRHGKQVTAINVTASETEDGLVLVWEDNGVGIPVEYKDRIFDRGFGKNTGLGLFLIREILSITGMAIRENGTPGKGARFEITVPKGSYGFSVSN